MPGLVWVDTPLSGGGTFIKASQYVGVCSHAGLLSIKLGRSVSVQEYLGGCSSDIPVVNPAL